MWPSRTPQLDRDHGRGRITRCVGLWPNTSPKNAEAVVQLSSSRVLIFIVNFIAMVMVTIPFWWKAVSAFLESAEVVTMAVPSEAPSREPIVVSHDAPDVQIELLVTNHGSVTSIIEDRKSVV